MRIALIAEVFLPKIDGVVLRTCNLIRHLREAGDEVLVVCPQGDSPGDGSYQTVEFPSFACPAYPEYRIGIPDDGLVAALDEFAPDVVHFVNPFAFGFRCHDRLVEAGRPWPTVFSFHTLYAEFVKVYGILSPLSRLLWWITRKYHNAADINLTVSGAMVDELNERGFERVRLWQPAVDSDLFDPRRADPVMRRRLSDGHVDAPLLLTASRLAPEKNTEFLADILRLVPQARLAIVGDGPHRAALERHFAGLPVTFTGFLKGTELASAYASADAFVYASETETMGNVVLEAMAAGLPVIAPRAGGIPSLVSHGRTGWLFAPRNIAEATAHVATTLHDHGLRRRMSAAARQDAAGRSWNAAALRLRGDYESAIAAGQRSAGRAEPQMPGAMARTMVAGLVLAFRLASAATSRKRHAVRPVEPFITDVAPAEAKSFA